MTPSPPPRDPISPPTPRISPPVPPQVLAALAQDFRLPPPPRCPAALHRLMLQCWERRRSARPRFADIVRALDRLIRRPLRLRETAGGDG